MCCFFTTLVLLGPRLGFLVWWLLRPVYMATVFGNWILPLLGVIFLPWTTLTYAILWTPVVGLTGFEWVLLIFAIFVDFGSYGGGVYGNRDRLR